MKESTWFRTIGAAVALTTATLLILFVMWNLWPGTSWAHYCDDSHFTQQARETCWWHYWNSLSIQQDRWEKAKPRHTPVRWVPQVPLPANPPLDGSVCDIYYRAQEDRANCWWRHSNGLPLFALAPFMSLPAHPATPAHLPSVPAYQPVPVPKSTFPPPRGTGSRCSDFDTRAQYEAFYTGRTKPSRHDRDRDGLYCEHL